MDGNLRIARRLRFCQPTLGEGNQAFGTAPHEFGFSFGRLDATTRQQLRSEIHPQRATMIRIAPQMFPFYTMTHNLYS
jgi:hypothetical protein